MPAANTVETYQNKVIREDLREAFAMISPEEVPFMTLAGTGPRPKNTLHEWPLLELAAPDADNRVIEGEDNPPADAGTLPNRLSNITQISDKVVVVSHTSENVDAAAGNVQGIAKQVSIKMRELKRDMETMALSNIPASLGASGTARAAAGFPAFLRTNCFGAAGFTAPTLSGGTDGYPNAAFVPGTPVAALTEAAFNNAQQQAWENGGNPTIALVNAGNKRLISQTFTGVSTRYKDVIDKTVINAVDIYDSDFGQMTIVPNRFQPVLDPAGAGTSYGVYGIDPDFVEVNYLQTTRQQPLAKSGHANRRLIDNEWTVSTTAEAAHFMIGDTNNVVPAS